MNRLLRLGQVLGVAMLAPWLLGAGAGVAADAVPSLKAISRTPADLALSPGCLDADQHADTDVEPTLAVNPADPNNMVATWWTGETTFQTLALIGGFAVTTNGGATWTTSFPRGIDGCGGNAAYSTAGGHDPWVVFGPKNRVYMIFESGAGSGQGNTNPQNTLWLFTSTDGGRSWSTARPILSEDPLMSGNDDQLRFVVDPVNADRLYLFWRQIPPVVAAVADQGLATSLAFSESTDAGSTWSKPADVYQPGDSTVVALQPVVYPNADGTRTLVVVDYTDNASTIGAAIAHESGTGNVPQQILVSRSTDTGVHWTTQQIAQASGQQYLTGPDEFENTPNTSNQGQFWQVLNATTAAAGPDGTLYSAWGDQSGDQPNAPCRILISSSTDRGATWSPPRPLPTTQSVGYFKIAVAGDGTVGLLHYDLSNDGAYWNTNVYLARSSDRGSTWSDQQVAGPIDLSKSPPWLDVAPFGHIIKLGDYLGMVGLPHGFAAALPLVNPTAPQANPTDIYFGSWPSHLQD